MKKLIELVEAAIERLQTPGVEGWGLSIDSELEKLGTLIETGPGGGCTSETCNCYSHDPAAPDYRWVPTEGRLVALGGEDDNEASWEWYVLIRDNYEPVFIEWVKGYHYHAQLRVIEAARVPDWALASLAEAN